MLFFSFSWMRNNTFSKKCGHFHSFIWWLTLAQITERQYPDPLSHSPLKKRWRDKTWLPSWKILTFSNNQTVPHKDAQRAQIQTIHTSAACGSPADICCTTNLQLAIDLLQQNTHRTDPAFFSVSLLFSSFILTNNSSFPPSIHPQYCLYLVVSLLFANTIIL